jgi:hypothetical protein
MMKALLAAAAALALCAQPALAQTPSGPTVTDARFTLKAGVHDAGQASSNIDLVVNVPTPEGFYDPQHPAGLPMNPDGSMRPKSADGREWLSPNDAPFGTSDIAFAKGRLIAGGYHGVRIYDIKAPAKPKLLVSIVCPSGQGDVSVYGNLLFLSAEQQRGRLDCGTGGAPGKVNAERFKGVRIFDISDIAHPRQVAAVQTCMGSHTNTLVPDPRDRRVLYVYNSGTQSPRAADEMAGCAALTDAQKLGFDVIRVPLDAPEKAALVLQGIPGRDEADKPHRCHDITAYPALGVAAAACVGDGHLLDISDPAHPVDLQRVQDKAFSAWHSATFNNDGTTLIFGDEWGSGVTPKCRLSDPPNQGSDAIMDFDPAKKAIGPVRSYYKLPGAEPDTENCTAHNGGLVPVPGRDIEVQGWYGGGTSVFDFTDAAHPVEIAWFDRGPLSAEFVHLGGHWAAYWYNGYVYAPDMARGFDVLKLKPSAQLTANELAAAGLVRQDELNVQTQPRLVWPDKPVVARAYLDQLRRSGMVTPARARQIDKALVTPGSVAAKALAGELDQQAAAAQGRDAERWRGIARILRATA